MKVVKRSISKLFEDDANARRHSQANIEAIKASLEAFGQQRAAVIRSDGRVLAGNGMLEAATRLGWTELHVTVVPDEWSDEQARAFALADNRTAELAEWDQEVLAAQLVDLDLKGFDLEDLGFASKTRDPADAPEDFEEFDDDIATEHQCPKCGYEWSGPSR
jgi:ParB-like chromosome segregation protein Spo0J